MASMEEIRTKRSGPRLRGHELQAAFAFALLHLNDIAVLTDSPLVDLPVVRLYWPDANVLFREGVGLAAALETTVRNLLVRFPDVQTGRVAFVRATLQAVALDHKSVASVARLHGKSREHWQRTYWPQAVALVAAALTGTQRPLAVG